MMDKVLILGHGQVLFDRQVRTSLNPDESAESAANAVHDIISRGTINGVRRSSLNRFLSQRTSSKNDSLEDDVNESTVDDVMHSLRLWQVVPLLERLHFEYQPSKQDILVLPICYLAISLWGRFDSDNPLQGKSFYLSWLNIIHFSFHICAVIILGFLVTATLTFIPCMIFQTRLIMAWGVLGLIRIPHLGFGG